MGDIHFDGEMYQVNEPTPPPPSPPPSVQAMNRCQKQLFLKQFKLPFKFLKIIQLIVHFIDEAHHYRYRLRRF